MQFALDHRFHVLHVRQAESEVESGFDGRFEFFHHERETRFDLFRKGALEFDVIEQHGQPEGQGDESDNRQSKLGNHGCGSPPLVSRFAACGCRAPIGQKELTACDRPVGSWVTPRRPKLAPGNEDRSNPAGAESASLTLARAGLLRRGKRVGLIRQARKRIPLFPGIPAVTRIDPSRMQALLSQDFDNARAPGQLGGRSVQMGQAEGSRVQPSASGFINKVKSLYDRDIRLQRAEEGVTRGVKNFDKALDKLLDAMKPDNKGDIDLAKARRCLEALPGSAKSATSRGADYDELFKARLNLLVAKTANEELEGLGKANVELINNFNNECERLGINWYSGPERLREAAHIKAWHLKEMDTVLGNEIKERKARPDYGLFP